MKMVTLIISRAFSVYLAAVLLNRFIQPQFVVLDIF